MEVLTSGPAADSLLVAAWETTDYSVFTFPLDPSTGLPLEGITPTPVAFATGTPMPWGLTVDPVTHNIWLTKWPETPVAGSADLLQITQRPIFADGFELGTTTAWSATVP